MPPHAPDSVGHEPTGLRLADEVIASQGVGLPVKRYTLQDVSKHNTPEDCWLVIWGKVYDVSSWVPKHPGGSLIFVKAGQDSTQLFDSYHPLYVRRMLRQYCVGELQRNAEDLKENYASIEYSDGDQEAFYLTMKQRVETYFRKQKINPRYHPQMFVKTAVIFAVYSLSYYYAFFGSHNIFLSMMLACIMGFCAAEVGVSIMHDGNHGAYSQSRSFGYAMGATLDLVGASRLVQFESSRVAVKSIRETFLVAGSSSPNFEVNEPEPSDGMTNSLDAEELAIQIFDELLRNNREDGIINIRVPWYFFPIITTAAFSVTALFVIVPEFNPANGRSHIYLGALYGLLALKSVLADDFSAILTGSIGSVKIAPMTPLELRIFVGGKAFYAVYMYLLPLIYGHYSIFTFIGLYILSQLVSGWTLALMFQVAHVVGDAAFPTVETDDIKSKVPSGWAEMQVRTTTNFSPRSSFWTHVSGGLNHQIEHHLFPGVCHLYYPSIQPIVKSTCDEFNVPYTAYPTFLAALKAHFGHLKEVGLQDGLRLDG